MWGYLVLSDNESKVFFEKVKGQHPEMGYKKYLPLRLWRRCNINRQRAQPKYSAQFWLLLPGRDSVNPPEQGRALYMMLLLLALRNYTRKLDVCHYDIYKGAFLNVAAVQTQWFKTSLIVGINMSEVVEVSLIS